MTDACLVIRNLDKSFAAPVLQDVSLTIAKGEIHAIVGENGAGKSTLVNILAGLVDKERGELLLGGERYLPTSARTAFDAGVSFAAQELSTIDTLSVAENINLRRLPCRGAVVSRQALGETAQNAMRLVGLEHIRPEASVGSLSIADRQLVELAKAMLDDSRLLILDEPTAALTAPQSCRLHELLRHRATSGTAVIYISHRLDDVLDIADTVSVLRDGRVVASAPANTLSVDELVESMAGEIFRKHQVTSDTKPGQALSIRADGITTRDLPKPISFNGHSGEIVGVAGLAGAGRSELLQALFGLAPLTGGSVTLHVESECIRISSASQAVSAGIAFLGEDRQSMGIYAGNSVLTNMMMPGGNDGASVFRRIDRKKEDKVGVSLARKLDIRCNSLSQDISELSGGNQQKALIGRWLNCDSSVYLLDEPTRGVDVGTKSAIYDILFELQGAGKCIVIASSEIEELMTVCDRVVVLSGRKPVREFQRNDWSEKAILAAAFHEFAQDTSTAEH